MLLVYFFNVFTYIFFNPPNWKNVYRQIIVFSACNSGKDKYTSESCSESMFRHHKYFWVQKKIWVLNLFWNTIVVDSPITYGSKALGTILIARVTSLGLHWPFSRPRAIPILFNTSISSWISKVLSKLNKYSYLQAHLYKNQIHLLLNRIQILLSFQD